MSDESSEFVETIVNTIVRVAEPEKVILFGSRASGTPTSESDYDFLVVMQDILNEREISRQIYRALVDTKIGVAVDIVVVSEEKLRQHRENPYYVYSLAIREGEVFYDRATAI